MRKTMGTAMLALALATGGSAFLGGTAVAGVGGTSGHALPSAHNNCGSFSTPNTGKCKDKGGKNATNNCVNTNGGSCTATATKGSSNTGGSATNNCVNINGTCKATTKP